MTNYFFDLDFQKHLLASFLGDQKFMEANLDVLNPGYFGDDMLQGIAEVALDFYKEHKEPPSKEAVIQELKGNLAPGRKLHEYKDTVDEVFGKVGVNPEYYQGKAVEFARTHHLASALQESIELVKSGDLDAVQEVISKAGKIGEGLGRKNFYDHFASLQERALRYFHLHTGKVKDNRIPTGFHPLDHRIQGGLAPGETGLMVAIPKHGKTTALVNMAVHALAMKIPTLYVTLELSKEVIASRFDTHIFGDSLDSIKKNAKNFYKKMKEFQEDTYGNLKIVEFPTHTLTIPQLKACIEKAAPKMVFVDYVSLMRTHTRDQKRHELTDLHEGLREVAGTCKLPIWSAHQANRPGMKAKILTLENLAEDFNIGAIHDILVSVNQTSDESRRGKLRFYIMGNRLGSSGDEIECICNWVTAKIQVAFGDNNGDLGG